MTPSPALPLLPLRLLAAWQVSLQEVLLATLPDGGQRAARRNAWRGMSDEAALRRTRREAEAAMAAAQARYDARTAAVRAADLRSTDVRAAAGGR